MPIGPPPPTHIPIVTAFLLTQNVITPIWSYTLSPHPPNASNFHIAWITNLFVCLFDNLNRLWILSMADGSIVYNATYHALTWNNLQNIQTLGGCASILVNTPNYYIADYNAGAHTVTLSKYR